MPNNHNACPSHCCPIHGCKYGHEDCPVVLRKVAPTYPNNNGCELCEDLGYVTLKMSRKRALELGLLTCGNCGWPANNHFDFPTRGSPIGDFGKGGGTHDPSCKAYVEVPRKGMERA